MDFDLSKPEQMLRESAREVFARQCPIPRVRELMASPSAFDARLWHAIAEQGWIGMHLPEPAGGLGLGLVALAVVAEETGRACVPGPFLGTLWAATLLAQLDNPAGPARYLEPILSGNLRASIALLEAEGTWDPRDVQLRVTAEAGGERYRAGGRKLWVLDGADAGLIVCVGRLDEELILFPVRSDTLGVTLTATPALDATRKLYQLDMNEVAIPAGEVLACGEPAQSALQRSIQVATVAVSAELVGIAQRVLEMTVDYARTRQQFDRPIGAFQAVQHQCADMLLWTESARSAAYYAAWAVSTGAPDAARALAVAKAYASDAARDVCHRAIQVHGGIGFTWEHDLHLYLKRAQAGAALFGDATFQREQIARLTLDSEPEPAHA
jgi:alkylation response protein AidB-like acyl-CoA dehydrogenase